MPGFNKLSATEQEVTTREFVAKLSLAADVIAKDLDVDTRAVIFLPQLDYHIDRALRPGPDGKIFLFNRAEVLRLAKQISKTQLRQDPNLAEHLEWLKAQGPRPEREDLFERNIRSQLELAGYDVVPMAASLDGKIGYLNGVMGEDPNGDPYYMTNRSPHPALDEAFAKAMKQEHGVRVLWVEHDYLDKYKAGVDCATWEIPG